MSSFLHDTGARLHVLGPRGFTMPVALASTGSLANVSRAVVPHGTARRLRDLSVLAARVPCI